MSYILDALRRADAERRQGHAPDLQQVTALPAGGHDGAAHENGRRGRHLLALGLVLLAGVGLAAWWFGRSGAPSPSPVTTAVAPAAPSAVAAAPAPTTPPVTAAPLTAPAPAPAPAPPPAPAPAPGPPRTAAAPPPAAAPAVATPSTRPVARPDEPAPRPTAPAAAPAPARPIPASALPEPQRSVVTALSVGGAVHSQDRSQSFVLVGGQIVHEGATLAPGIVLERIQPRALWLRVDDRLVELPL